MTELGQIHMGVGLFGVKEKLLRMPVLMALEQLLPVS